MTAAFSYPRRKILFCTLLQKRMIHFDPRTIFLQYSLRIPVILLHPFTQLGRLYQQTCRFSTLVQRITQKMKFSYHCSG